MSDRHDSFELNKLEIGELTGWTDTMIEDYRSIGDSLNDLYIKINAVAGIVPAPATSTSTGNAGQIAYDSSFFYVCTAQNIWVRAALSTW